MADDRSPSPDAGSLLFAYGTLMRGQSAAHLLASAQFIGRARTRERFTMVSLGPYPAICEGCTSTIEGELYRVEPSTWAELDAYEECPDVYRRQVLALTDGSSAEAYVLPLERLPPTSEVIASGRWGSPRRAESPTGSAL